MKHRLFRQSENLAFRTACRQARTVADRIDFFHGFWSPGKAARSALRTALTTSKIPMLTASKFDLPLGGGTDGETIQFEIAEEYGACRLRASYRDQIIDLSGPDFFTALCQMRIVLALSGFHPTCYGASLDVYCIDSIRATGRGLVAYQLTMGQQPEEADLVETFAYGPDVCAATVVDQAEYYQHWLESVAA